MITREQIEKLQKAHVVVGRNGARFVAVSEADYEALCALALERLDMQERAEIEVCAEPSDMPEFTGVTDIMRGVTASINPERE